MGRYEVRKLYEGKEAVPRVLLFVNAGEGRNMTEMLHC